MFKCFMFLTSLFFSFLTFGQQNYAPSLLRSTGRVAIENFASGSAAAIQHWKEGTLWITNDHVCQWTKGIKIEVVKNPKGKFEFAQRLFYEGPLNQVEPQIYNNGRSLKGIVLKTSNISIPKEFKISFNSKFDLCIIYTKEVVPLVKVDNNIELYAGQEIFSISAPHGYFPVITGGYLGPNNNEGDWFTSMVVHPGSSGGGVFDKFTGTFIGTIYAMLTNEMGQHLLTVLIEKHHIMEYLKTLKTK